MAQKKAKIIAWFFISILILLGHSNASDKVRIAIYPLETKGGLSPSLGGNLTDLLQTEISSLKLFEVLERANLQRVIKEQSLQNSGCTESSCAVKIGNLLNVQKMIVGSIFKIGDVFWISISFVNVELGKIESSEKISAERESDLAERIEKLAQLIKVKTPIRGRVLKIEKDQMAVCNLGLEDGAKIGDKVRVSRQGESIVDKETGNLLGKRIDDLGTGELVTSLGPNLSVFRSLGNLILKEGDLLEISPEGANERAQILNTVSAPPNPAPVFIPSKVINTEKKTTKTALRNIGIGTAVAGGLTLGVNLVLNDKYQKAKETYQTATGNFASLFDETQKLNQATAATGVMGYSFLGVGGALVVVGMLLPETKKFPLQFGGFPTPDGVQVYATYSFK